jgi:hypothetical protein
MAKCKAQLIDIATKQSWYKQAFLMSYVHPLVNPLLDWNRPGAAISKYIKLIETYNDSEAIVNHFTVSPEVITFFDGRPIDYSQLVPHIEIYKVYLKNKEDVFEILFPFKAYTDFNRDWSSENLLGSPFRGRDAGIVSVDVKMDGKGRNPFSANIMHVTLKLVFNDVKTLFKQWATKEGFSAQYSDLIRYPPSMKNEDVDDRSLPAAFRIRMSLGWNVNENNSVLKEMKGGKDFIKAIQQSRMNFVGDMFTHDLEFKEDGSVELSIQYKGALEAAFSSVTADIMNQYNVSDDVNILQLKAQLASLELTHLEKVVNSSSGPRKKGLARLLNIKKASAKLKATEKMLDKLMKDAQGDTETFVKVKPAVNKDYKAFKSSLETYSGTSGLSVPTKHESLNAAVRGTQADKQRNYREKIIKSVDTDLNALLGKDKKQYKKYQEELQKASSAIQKKIVVLEANMRAENMFVYTQKLMANDRIMWVPTSETTAFGGYVRYMEDLKGGDPEAPKGEGAADASQMMPAWSTHISPAPTESADIAKNAGSKVKEKVENEGRRLDTATKTTVKITLADGTTQVIDTFKKSGTLSRYFTMDKYIAGDKIMFFVLGDLISAILDHAKFGEGIEQLAPDFRLLFGKMDFTAADSDHLITTNLYYLPVSLEMFSNFIAQKIVSEGKRAYPLMMFIQDLIKFVMDSLVSSLGKSQLGTAMLQPKGEQRTNFKLDISSIDLPKNSLLSIVNKDGQHINPILTLGEKSRPKQSAARQTLQIQQISNAFLFHAKKHEPFRERVKKAHTADPVQDRKEGIMHFTVGGPNRGLLKSIKFKENTNSLLATALMRNAQAGGVAAGRGIIKPAKYECELQLVGNPYFYIGQYIYINTDLISGGHFARESIMNGGYYTITSVQSHLGSDGWETTVVGILEIADMVIRGKNKDATPGAVKTVGNMSPSQQEELKQKQNEAANAETEAISGHPTVQ